MNLDSSPHFSQQTSVHRPMYLARQSWWSRRCKNRLCTDTGIHNSCLCYFQWDVHILCMWDICYSMLSEAAAVRHNLFHLLEPQEREHFLSAYLMLCWPQKRLYAQQISFGRTSNRHPGVSLTHWSPCTLLQIKYLIRKPSLLGMTHNSESPACVMKVLLWCIKSLKCYELTRRCSNLVSPLAYEVHPWSTDCDCALMWFTPEWLTPLLTGNMLVLSSIET